MQLPPPQRPRAVVLDEVWRRLDRVAPLSAPHGGPLRRTVKLILDPLVIRPVQHPACAGPLLGTEGAAVLADRVLASAETLRATADWFTVLKRTRRTMQITEGNPQDLYFQRCFELATTTGAPDPATVDGIAEKTLIDVHSASAGRTTDALKAHLTDPEVVGELAARIDATWRRRQLRADPPDDGSVVEGLLEACAAARLGEGADTGPFDDLVDTEAGSRHGISLWGNTTPSARELGLTVHRQPAQPRLGSGASTATLALPFDRSVYERVFTVLQVSADRAELPPIDELVSTEIERSCTPWALRDETLRVAATAGAALAVGLTVTGAKSGTTEAHRLINSRWQREAYVLAARRQAVHDDAPPSSPLAAVAADLRKPWRTYLRRLWVRLHGRDVRDLAIDDLTELWDLLDGVARSVILDHRMRVKQALSAAPVVEEARAS